MAHRKPETAIQASRVKGKKGRSRRPHKPTWVLVKET